MKCCKSCRWFVPFRNPETGRTRPSMSADCSWAEFEWPEKWPVAYTWGCLTKPAAGKTWSDNGENCPCWADKVRKPVRTVQAQLPGVAATETTA